MSLTSLIQHPQVREILDEISPAVVRSWHIPTVVPSTTSSGYRQRVGIAFDYALRFEVARLSGVSAGSRWAADYGLAIHARVPGKTKEHAQFERAVRDAHRYVDRYSRRSRAPRPTKLCLAIHALRLAAFDPLYRAHQVFEINLEPPAGAVDEVVDLLEAATLEDLLRLGPPILNPNFGLASALVGGADADMVLGNTLIEIKTVKDVCVEREYVRQLLGYALLARRARRLGSDLPPIAGFGIYFSRHAYFVQLPPAVGGEVALERAEDEFFSAVKAMRPSHGFRNRRS
ncbi:MAG: hypothetical protein KJ015_09915 [Myxococcales bacterium]|nr:hypothetical protein [Myxococcales bacterium]